MKSTFKFILLIVFGLVLTLSLCGCGEFIDEILETPAPTEQPEQPESTEPSEETDELTVQHGELLSVIEAENNIVIVKTKISPSINNKTTIDQNYYNIVALIHDDGFGKYSEIQYWAVADMSDGSEQKVISFTVPASVIEEVAANSEYPANTLGDSVEELWVHPSLN